MVPIAPPAGGGAQGMGADAWLGALVAPGLALLVGGVWMVWGKRAARTESTGQAAAATAAGASEARPDGWAGAWVRARAWRDGLTQPTRLVLGLCAILVGYHVLAYVLPGHWLPLRVPVERWWWLGVGVVLAVGATLGLDKMEKRLG